MSDLNTAISPRSVRANASTPPVTIGRLLGALWRRSQVCRVRSLWRRWHGEDNLRALADLDAGQLSDLSEAGQRLRRQARWRASARRRDQVVAA